MLNFVKIFSFFLLFAPLTVKAVVNTPYFSCFNQAAKMLSVDREILISIGKQESNYRATALNVNKDLTVDVGVMQINTRHLPMLGLANISKRDLFEPCLNVHIGAFVLKECERVFGKTWEAVGCYNAGTSSRLKSVQNRQSYAKTIKSIYVNLSKKEELKNGWR